MLFLLLFPVVQRPDSHDAPELLLELLGVSETDLFGNFLHGFPGLRQQLLRMLNPDSLQMILHRPARVFTE